MEEKISVIICTKDRPEALDESITSILANSILPFEVLIIDQSEALDYKQKVKRIAEKASFIIYMENNQKGVSTSKNLGIKSCQGEILAFTDDDCLVSRIWIENAQREFSFDPKISCVVGRVLHQSTMDENQVKEVTRGGKLFQDKFDPWKIGPSGGNIFIKKSVFDKIGLFDSLFGPGGRFKSAEDADILYRISKAKVKIKFSPSVVVAHNRPRAGCANYDRILNYGIGISAFVLKHISFQDLLPLRIFLVRFLTESIRTFAGALLLKKEMTKEGYMWIKGFSYGFWLFLKEKKIFTSR